MSVRLIPIGEIPPGVVLAEDLRDPAGNVLLRRGAEISASGLDSLRRREVDALPLEIPEAGEGETRAVRSLIITQDLKGRFRAAGEGEAARLLHRATLEYLLEKHACKA